MKPAAILFLLSYVILEVKHVQGITIHLPPKEATLFSCPQPKPSPKPRPPPSSSRHNCGCCCCCSCHGHGQPNMHQQHLPPPSLPTKPKPTVKIPSLQEIMNSSEEGPVCIYPAKEGSSRTLFGSPSGLGFFL